MEQERKSNQPSRSVVKIIIRFGSLIKFFASFGAFTFLPGFSTT